MKKIVTFLNGITSQGTATLKLIFIPGPCFLTGPQAPKSMRPLLLQLSIQVFRVTGKGVSLVEGFLIYRAPSSARLFLVSGGQLPSLFP